MIKIFVTPTPALMAACNCTEAIKRGGVALEFEGQTLVAIAETLIELERRGTIVFTDDTTPRYESSRLATSAELKLGRTLKEVIGALSDLCVEDMPFWEHSENAIAEAKRLRVRRAIGAAETALGL